MFQLAQRADGERPRQSLLDEIIGFDPTWSNRAGEPAQRGVHRGEHVGVIPAVFVFHVHYNTTNDRSVT